MGQTPSVLDTDELEVSSTGKLAMISDISMREEENRQQQQQIVDSLEQKHKSQIEREWIQSEVQLSQLIHSMRTYYHEGTLPASLISNVLSFLPPYDLVHDTFHLGNQQKRLTNERLVNMQVNPIGFVLRHLYGRMKVTNSDKPYLFLVFPNLILYPMKIPLLLSIVMTKCLIPANIIPNLYSLTLDGFSSDHQDELLPIIKDSTTKRHNIKKFIFTDSTTFSVAYTDWIMRCDQLESLEIHCGVFECAEIGRILDSCRDLKYLNYIMVATNNHEVYCLCEAVGRHHSLTHLKFKSYQQEFLLSSVLRSKSLLHLQLDGVDIVELKTDDMTQRNLRTFELHNSDMVVIELAGYLQSCPSLWHVVLKDCPVTSDHASQILVNERIHHLEVCGLSRYIDKVDDASFERELFFIHKNLMYLNLLNTSVTIDCIKKLTKEQLPNLTTLIYRFHQDSIDRELLEIMHESELREIHFFVGDKVTLEKEMKEVFGNRLKQLQWSTDESLIVYLNPQTYLEFL
jgi:hypothetical protein